MSLFNKVTKTFQWGDKTVVMETGEITLDVAKTFVPATIPEMKSTDARELGVRVFRAYLQPA